MQSTSSGERPALAKRGQRLEYFTIAWNSLEGLIAIGAGAVAGAVVAGAIIATRPPGYVLYPGYAVPVAGPGCYWASQPVYDRWGRVVGFTGQPVQVCPGYVAPAPAPYAGTPPAVELPPK